MSAVPAPPEPPVSIHPPKVVTRPSLLQVIASALAAVTAAVLSGAFGVAGTFIGAAVASVVASVGSTLYLASLRNTHERLRRVAARQAFLFGQTSGQAAPTMPTALTEPPAAPSRWSRLRWSELRSGLPTLRRRWIAVIGLAAVVFALAIGVLTGIEASTNKPVSSLLGGTSGSGTSIGQTVNPPAASTPTPKATPSPAATPSATVSPSVAPTPSASASVSPVAPSSTPAASESPTPSPSVTVSTSPSGTLATVP